MALRNPVRHPGIVEVKASLKVQREVNAVSQQNTGCTLLENRLVFYKFIIVKWEEETNSQNIKWEQHYYFQIILFKMEN